MSGVAKDAKLSLKVIINKEKTKVHFAEADSDVADVLLSFLTLPLGRIAKLLEKNYADKAPVFGSITSLYKSLSDLDDAHFSSTVAKKMLLDPRSCSDSICRNLKINIGDSTATKYFTCQLGAQHNCKSVCMYSGARCDHCGNPFSKEVLMTKSKDAGGFTVSKASFIISDDLRIIPYSNKGFLQILSSLGVTVGQGAELRNVTLGTNEIVDLLKCCLLSKTPLTDFILNKGEIVSFPAKPTEPGYLLHKIGNEKSSSSSKKKIILNVMLQKSTNKVLFAQADADFIELLFSFLVIPIAGVASLSNAISSLKNFDNLHRSISDVTLDKFFLSLDKKKRLTNPTIPPFYKSKNTILPLIEESPPTVYLSYQHVNNLQVPTITHFWPGEANSVANIKSPKGDVNYVMGPITFMVTDDLTVTPCCMSSIFTFIDRLNVPLSDVDELEVPIGLPEILSILKASLTSTSALTNGLINHVMIRKQPKQEDIKPHHFHPYKK